MRDELLSLIPAAANDLAGQFWVTQSGDWQRVLHDVAAAQPSVDLQWQPAADGVRLVIGGVAAELSAQVLARGPYALLASLAELLDGRMSLWVKVDSLDSERHALFVGPLGRNGAPLGQDPDGFFADYRPLLLGTDFFTGLSVPFWRAGKVRSVPKMSQGTSAAPAIAFAARSLQQAPQASFARRAQWVVKRLMLPQPKAQTRMVPGLASAAAR